MGSTEASEKDEIGLAHVSISKDGGSVQRKDDQLCGESGECGYGCDKGKEK